MLLVVYSMGDLLLVVYTRGDLLLVVYTERDFPERDRFRGLFEA